MADQGGQALLDGLPRRPSRTSTVQAILGGDGGALRRPKRWVSPVEEAFQPMVAFGVRLRRRQRRTRSPRRLRARPRPLRRQDGRQGGRRLADMKDSKVPADPRPSGKHFQDAFRGHERSALVVAERVHAPAALSPLLMNPIRLATPACSATSPAPQAASGSSTSGRSGATSSKASTPSPTRPRTRRLRTSPSSSSRRRACSGSSTRRTSRRRSSATASRSRRWHGSSTRSATRPSSSSATSAVP